MTDYLRETTLKVLKDLIWLRVSEVTIHGQLAPLFPDVW